MIGRCESCKYWWQASTGIDGQMTCIQPKALIGYRHNKEDIPKDGVQIELDEGWGWVVGPKFGCVHHEPKG